MKGYVIIADIVTYLPSINVQNVNVPYTLTQKYNDVHEWNDICTHNSLRIILVMLESECVNIIL